MVADVCLGKVGAVAAREFSRFARNSREWQQLVKVCRVVDTLLVDQETVYAPRQSNDRLLLGLKGSLNEYELDLLRQRSVEARREKARRGELLVLAPVGFLKTEDQRLEKDPDERVQEAIWLVFRKFQELGTARQTLLWFNEEGLQLPAWLPDGSTGWKRPTYATVYRFLTHPVYGGAYAYGKTEQIAHYDRDVPQKRCRRKRREQWLALIPEAHDGYIEWEPIQQIGRAIVANSSRDGGEDGRSPLGRIIALSSLRSEVDGSLYRPRSRRAALFLRARLDGSGRAEMHCFRGHCRGRRDRSSSAAGRRTRLGGGSGVGRIATTAVSRRSSSGLAARPASGAFYGPTSQEAV